MNNDENYVQIILQFMAYNLKIMAPYICPNHTNNSNHLDYSYLEEAPIYFLNIFISFLGLAYFTPLGWSLRFKFFLAL